MANKEYNDVDIAQAWQKLAAEKFSHSTIKKQDIMTAIKMESNSSITQLKTRLKYKMYWAIGITLGLIVALLYFSGNPDLTILLGIGVGVYVVGIIPMYLKYRKIEESIVQSGDVLGAMKYNADLIKSMLKGEKNWGLVTFIPAVVIGVLFGKVMDGYTLLSCFQDARIVTTMLLLALVAVPLMVWTTDKMNKKAYGDDLKKLEENIIKMETLQ